MPSKMKTDVSSAAFARAVVAHHTGPRSPRFPEVNIAATARLLGITKGFLSSVLSGKCRAGIVNAIAIARAFNITVEELNSYYQERKRETVHAKSKPSGRTERKKRKRAA